LTVGTHTTSSLTQHFHPIRGWLHLRDYLEDESGEDFKLTELSDEIEAFGVHLLDPPVTWIAPQIVSSGCKNNPLTTEFGVEVLKNGLTCFPGSSRFCLNSAANESLVYTMRCQENRESEPTAIIAAG
jgi:hypothetical protein